MTATVHRLKTISGNPSYWFLLLVLAVVAAYSTTISSMFSVWWEDDSAYSHGLLLSFIAIYIFAKNWHGDKSSLSPGFHPVSFVLLLVCIPLWVASHLMFVQSAEQFFFLAILFFLFPAILGFKSALKYLFPIILLLVAVPVWGAGVSVLQLLTTIASAFFLKLTGITSVRDGFFILVPAGTFEVEAACSGLRYQLAGLSISLLYAYMARMKILSGIFFLCCSVVVVFMANVTRIYIVVLVGEKTQMQSSLVADHLWLGWVIFAIYISLFLWAAEKIIPMKNVDEKDQNSGEKTTPGDRAMSGGQTASLFLVLFTCLSGPLVVSYFSLERYRDDHMALDFPLHSDIWSEVSDVLTFIPMQPRYQKANGELSKIYKNTQNRWVSYQQYYYLFQEQGREAINALNQAYDERYWKALRHSVVEIPGGVQGQAARVKETLLSDASGKKKLLWLWYRTNGKFVASEKSAKLENLRARLKGQPSIAVNIMSTDIRQDEEAARQVLGHFIDYTLLTTVIEKNESALSSR